ncbi:MAG: alpha amylase C-terminal domain-containing protein, partial [Pseudomonadota bacterium]
EDPINRKYHHDKMTFGLHYAFSENFILPISHDEVVHGKGSMLGKMPGDTWQQFANLRAFYGFMWGHPGKKLLFMGCEFAQWEEWNHDFSLDWDALHGDKQRGMQTLVRDLNHLYRNTPALSRKDCERDGFAWIANDPEQSLTAFVRYGEADDQPVVIVCNFTPVERRWRIGLPLGGRWAEILNTDASVYGGADRGNDGQIEAGPIKWDGHAQSAEITVPPLATIMFQHRV